ncbi:MAG: N-acetylmuramoyl-L-alanine amidase [Planctomycetota bacterium]
MATTSHRPWATSLGLIILMASVASADPAGRAALEAVLRQHGAEGPFPVLYALGRASDLEVDSGDVVAALSATGADARLRRLLSGVTSLRAQGGEVRVQRLVPVELPFGNERARFDTDLRYRLDGDDLAVSQGLSYGSGATLPAISRVRRAAPAAATVWPGAGSSTTAPSSGLAGALGAVPPMARGAHGEDVRRLQQLLNWDRRAAGSPALEEDGVFGPDTETALHEFQARRGLPQGNVVDAAAWAALEAARPRGAQGSPLLQRGDRSSSVRSLQWLLNQHRQAAGQPVVDTDGIFGDGTDRALRNFQRDHGLLAHGVSDAATWAALRGTPAPSAPASTAPAAVATLHNGSRGDDVRALQRRLNLHREVLGLGNVGVDGIFGDGTERAVTEFQRRSGLPPSGRADAATLAALNRDPVQPTAPAAPSAPVTHDGTLRGMKIAIDSGHGMTDHGFDPGALNRATGLTEYDINRRVTARLKELLEARGAQVSLNSYPRDGARRTLYQKGAVARGHHLFVSVHHNSGNKKAQGSMVLVHRDLANSQSLSLARAIEGELARQLWNGAKRYDLGVRRQGLGVLRGAHSQVRTAVLVEGFFVDPPDVNQTKVTTWIELEARSIAAGIAKYWENR